MMLENLMKELNEKGYRAESRNVIKNGVDLIAIVITDDNSNVSPTIYYDDTLTVEKVINIYEKHKVSNFNLSDILTDEYILNNCYIALQKESNEELIKRKSILSGIEEYIYIRLTINNENGTIKLTKDIIAHTTIPFTKLWKTAVKNTSDKTILDSVEKVLFGIETEKPLFYILSNTDRHKGSGSIVNTDLLKDFANKHNATKLLILPSSIHELLVVPYNDNMNVDDFSKMVKEVNASQVAETERLTDNAYIIEV